MAYVLRAAGSGRSLWVRCESELWGLVSERPLATRWPDLVALQWALERAPGPIRVAAEVEDADA